MLNWIIDFSLRHRFAVIVTILAGWARSFFALAFGHRRLPGHNPCADPGQHGRGRAAPEEIERQVTVPVEQAISGLPGLENVRSISKFGLSQVVVTFRDGTDIYFARQLVNERLGTVELPDGIPRPQMGPVSTGLGEVFHYTLTYDGYDFSKLPADEREKNWRLRTIHDTVVKPQLRAVPGVAEVNSWGGFEKQYQVRVDPSRLVKHGLTFDQVTEAVRENNRNVGGGSIAVGSQSLLVHGLGRTASLEQIGSIVVAAKNGAAIRVRDVANVETGHEIRLGAVTARAAARPCWGWASCSWAKMGTTSPGR